MASLKKHISNWKLLIFVFFGVMLTLVAFLVFALTPLRHFIAFANEDQSTAPMLADDDRSLLQSCLSDDELNNLNSEDYEIHYSWTKKDDGTYCVAYYLEDGKYVVEEVKATSVKTVNETESADGTIVHTATFINTVFGTKTENETVPKLGTHQNHDGITFQPWDTSNAFPTSNPGGENTGYYLNCDVSTDQKSISSKVNVCLNGHKVTNSTEWAIIAVQTNGELHLFDCRHDHECYRKRFNIDSSTRRWQFTSSSTSDTYIDGGCFYRTDGNKWTYNSLILNMGKLYMQNINIVGGKSESGAGLSIAYSDSGVDTETHIVGGGFYGNTATKSGGAINCLTEDTTKESSKIWNIDLEINGTEFIDNSLSLPSDTNSSCHGGAIQFASSKGSVRISNSKFIGNFATSARVGGPSRGGALYLDGNNNTDVPFVIDNCYFAGNYAQNTATSGSCEIMGGAMSLVESKNVLIKDTDIVNGYIKATSGDARLWGGGIQTSASTNGWTQVTLSGKVNVINNYRLPSDTANKKDDNFSFEQCKTAEPFINGKVRLADDFDATSKIGINMWNWDLKKHKSGQTTEGYYNRYSEHDQIPAFYVDDVLVAESESWAILESRETQGVNREVYIGKHNHDFSYELSGGEEDSPRNLIASCPDNDPTFMYHCRYETPLVVSLVGQNAKYDGQTHGVEFNNLDELQELIPKTQQGTITYEKKDNSGNWTKCSETPKEYGTYRAKCDVTCYAKKSDTESSTKLTVVSNEYAITKDIMIVFDAQGGTWPSSSNDPTKLYPVQIGANFHFPDNPTKSDNVFAGWYSDTSFSEGKRVTDQTLVTEAYDSVTLYAKWSGDSGASGGKGSKWSEASGTVETSDAAKTLPVGISYKVCGNKIIFDNNEDMYYLAKEGANEKFAFWSLAADGTKPLKDGDTGVVESGTAFYAQFAPLRSINASVSGNGSISESSFLPYQLMDGATWSHTLAEDYKIIISEPAEYYQARTKTITLSPTDGYSLDKWKIGETEISGDTSGTIGSGGATFTAVTKSGYSVLLNKNGGTGGKTYVSPVNGQAMPTLTSADLPKFTGYKFLGYWDAATDSGTTAKQYYNADGTSKTPWDKSSNSTLYARWQEKNTINIDSAKQNLTYDSKAKSFVVKPDSGGPSAESFVVQYYYNGSWISTPPTDAGKYDVKVTRVEDGDYKEFSETIEGGLVIDRLDIYKDGDPSVVIRPMTYSGSVQNPGGEGTTVTKNGLEVTGSWTDVTNVTDTTVFTANGNFIGTIDNVVTDMQPLSISDFKVGVFAEMTYNGTEQTPSATVSKTLSGKLLQPSGSWSKVTNVGQTSTFTPSDKNYKDTITKDPGMKQLSISDFIVGDFTEMTYNGSEQTPSATVSKTVFGKLLQPAGSWSKVTNVGQTSTFTPTDGNYKDTITGKDPKMAQLSVSDFTVGDFAEMTYNGTEQTPSATVSKTLSGKLLQPSGSWSKVTNVGQTSTFTPSDKNYKDTITKDPGMKQLSISDFIVGPFASMIYTGDEQTPVAKVYKDSLEATGSWSEVKDVADTTTFTASGNFTGTLTTSPGMAKATPRLDVPESASYEVPTPGSFDTQYNGDGELSFSISEPGIVSVSIEGTKVTVTPISDGEAIITISATEGNNYNKVEGKNFKAIVATGKIAYTETTSTDLVYDGSSKTLCVVTITSPSSAKVKYWVDGKEVDAPVASEAGTHSVKYEITATGYETVSKTISVDIAQKTITSGEIQGIKAQYTYTGDQIKPVPTVVVDGVTLNPDTDYTIEYGNNKTVAEGGSVIIKGKGNYQGEIEQKFSISKKQAIITLTPTMDEYVVPTSKTFKYSFESDVASAKVESADTSIATVQNDLVNKQVTVNPIKAGTVKIIVSVDDGINYTSASAEYSATITAGKITVTEVPASESTLVYSGNAVELGSVTPSVDGCVVEYSVNGAAYSTQPPTATDAGKYTVSYKVTKEGYAPASGSFEVEIIKSSSMSVMCDGYLGEYDGAEHQPVATSNIQTGTTIYYSMDGGENWDTQAPKIKNVSEILVDVKAENKNYNTAFNKYTLKVTSKSVSVTADNKEIAYGDDEPELTATVTGTIGQETVSYTLSRTPGTDVANYIITASGEEYQGNYVVSFFAGELIIKKSDGMTLRCDGYSGQYDASTHNVVPTCNIALGVTIEYQIDGGDWTTAIPSIKDVGYVEVIARASHINYNTVSCSYTLTVLPKEVTVKANDAAKVPSAPDPSFSAVVSGTYKNDKIIYTISKSSTEKSPGVYEIIPTGVSLQGNYYVSFVNGVFTVSDTTLIVTCDSYSGEYDGQEHSSVASTNLGANVSYKKKGSADPWSSEAPKITEVGTQEYEVKAESQSNAIATCEFSLTVQPRAVTVTALDDGKHFEEKDPGTFKANVEGLIGTDTIDYSLERHKGEEVGTYQINATGEAIQGNYLVTYDIGVFSIYKSNKLTVECESYNAPYDCAYHGCVATVNITNGTSISYSVDGQKTWQDLPPEYKDAGNYHIDVKAANGKYDTVYTSYDINISKIDAKVVADDYAIDYGQPTPSFTAKVYDTLGTDVIDYSLIQQPSGINAGQYAIKVIENTPSVNYNVDLVDGLLTIRQITPKMIVEATATDSVDVERTIDTQYNGDGKLDAVSSDMEKLEVSVINNRQVKITPKHSGHYTITISASGGTNYSDIDVTQTTSVTAMTIQVTPVVATDLKYTGSELTLGYVSTQPSGCQIDYTVVKSEERLYSFDEANASEAKATNAGKYLVTYTVSKTGYDTVTGSFNSEIAKADNPHPEGPSSMVVKSLDETISAKNDGSITGVDDTMEYRMVTTNSNQNWTPVPEGASKVENLSSGDYEVRYQGNENINPSNPLALQILAGRKICASFDANGHGTAPSDQSLNYHDRIAKPADLECVGFVFGGWFQDKECSKDKVWDFVLNAVEDDTTLYAKWTAAGEDPTHDPVNNNPGQADGSNVSQSGDNVIALIGTLACVIVLISICCHIVKRRISKR